MSERPKWWNLLHDLWGWAVEQPGYQQNRRAMKNKFFALESEILKAIKRERKTQRRKGERRRVGG